MVYKRKNSIPYALLFFSLYIVHFVIKIASGDDVFFAEASQKYSLFSYLSMRYETWTGRLFPEMLLYILLGKFVWLWRMLNPIFLITLCYSMVRITKKNVHFYEVCVVLLTIGYFSHNILSSGFFWITGTMNYLWPITLGIVVLIPYADAVIRNDISQLGMKKIMCLMLIALFAANSNEQVSLCLIALALISHVVLFLRKIRHTSLLLVTICMIVGCVILFSAPGNYIRWEAEVSRWFPAFVHFTFKDYFHIGIIWAYDKIFNEMHLLVILLSVVTVIVTHVKKPKSKTLFYFLTILVALIVSLDFLKKGMPILYDFKAIQSISMEHMMQGKKKIVQSFFPYVFWSTYSIILLYFTILNSKNRVLTMLTFLASISSIVVIFFTPTIYASGNRVLSLSAILFAFIIVKMILEEGTLKYNILFLIYGAIPVVNVSMLFIDWFLHGYRLFY